MSTWTNIGLMIYFALVSLIGTLGNGMILFAYGNRWNSSRSTSIVFILLLACFDLWTCLIVAPSFAFIEYREFEVPTLFCRFYSFSKSLIISSSLIMSFIALDRFLNIAAPHHRLLNPRRVKVLLTLFLLIGIGFGILIALAFSTIPFRETYHVDYQYIQSDDHHIIYNGSDEISLRFDQKNVTYWELIEIIQELIILPPLSNITHVNLTYLSTHESCHAETSIISETVRNILRHISNKCFFTSIGIVLIFYAITFILALQRQNPRIRALKKSLNVLNKFNSQTNERPSIAEPRSTKQRIDSIASYYPLSSSGRTRISLIDSNGLTSKYNPQYEMASFISNDDLDEQQNVLNVPERNSQIYGLELTSDDLQNSNMKQVSFQVDNHDDHQQIPFLNQSYPIKSEETNETFYKFPCPCSTTRQLLIKFHFAQPRLDLNQWLCYCCLKKSQPTINQRQSSIITTLEDEPSTMFASTSSSANLTPQRSHSDILKKQLYRHRLKQIRMALTFLIITVSFVLFYLPSILTAERIIKSPILIYYLFLCTHALNPIIYCFMNMNLRAYVFSMFKCRKVPKNRSQSTGTVATLDR